MDEASFAAQLITQIERECPKRRPTSEDERRAQQIMEQEFARLGVASRWQPFRFNDSLYAHLALHFGLGTLGTLVGGVLPPLGLALHGLSSYSYWREGARRLPLLRRLLPYGNSQNLLATVPAQGEPELRLVFLAHADASYTGLFFQPEVIRLVAEAPRVAPGLLHRPVALAASAQAVLAGIDLLRCALGPLALPLRPLEYLLTIPSLLVFLVNLQAVLQDEIVPGANDDLSGVAALPVLARRLLPKKPPGVELVFVVTGCEEPGFGGADALAAEMEGVWDKRRTVVLALDCIGLGEPHYVTVEGDLARLPVPGWLVHEVEGLAASDARFAGLRPYKVPVGGTDAAPFLARGWSALGLICLDLVRGCPGNYHLPADRSENLDLARLLQSIDLAEALAARLIAARVTAPARKAERPEPPRTEAVAAD